LAKRDMRTDTLHDTLLAKGCLFQQRMGFERPGWFVKDKSLNMEKKPYDYYGSYGHEKHADYPYRDMLDADYTFGYPPHFDIIGAEAEACRSSAALFNMSYFGKFFLSGTDAQAAVNYLCCSNVEKGQGATTYTNMLNSNGGSETDLTVSHVESCPETGHDVFYIAAGGSSAYRDMCHVLNVIDDKGFNCTMKDRTSELVSSLSKGPVVKPS